MRSYTLKCVAKRTVSSLMLMLVLFISASAYTIVRRDGRRIEIPSNFTVTQATLTYEVAEGIQITLQLAAIDIPATEKANNELPGSLLRRVEQSSSKTDQARIATRSITNRDLEATVRRRRQSEQSYEVRRKELGLPSVEESRNQAATESATIERELQEKRALETESESYWRERASALRTEIAVVEAELNYVRMRLEEVPSVWTGGFTSVSVAPFISFGNFGNFGRHSGGFGRPFGRQPGFRPRVFTTPARGSQLTARVGFGGGATRGRVLINPGNRTHQGLTGFGSFSPVLPFAVCGSDSEFYDFSYERSELITRFNELAGTRAGLKARWRELEEEARRAGAPPGWLRP